MDLDMMDGSIDYTEKKNEMWTAIATLKDALAKTPQCSCLHGVFEKTPSRGKNVHFSLP
jgi:hypothetical protein